MKLSRVYLVALLAVLFGAIGVTSAPAAPSSSADWHLNSSTANGTKSALVHPDAEAWSCDGVAFTPGTVKDASGKPYVHASAKQTCFLAFKTQHVCAAVEEFYAGDFHQISTWKCTGQTANITTTANATLSCSSIGGRGIFRSAGEGFAYPDGVPVASGEHDSAEVTLC